MFLLNLIAQEVYMESKYCMQYCHPKSTQRNNANENVLMTTFMTDKLTFA